LLCVAEHACGARDCTNAGASAQLAERCRWCHALRAAAPKAPDASAYPECDIPPRQRTRQPTYLPTASSRCSHQPHPSHDGGGGGGRVCHALGPGALTRPQTSGTPSPLTLCSAPKSVAAEGFLMVDMRENKTACHTATGAAAKNGAPGESIQDASNKCWAAALGRLQHEERPLKRQADARGERVQRPRYAARGGTTLWGVWGRGVWTHARAPRECARRIIVSMRCMILRSQCTLPLLEKMLQIRNLRQCVSLLAPPT
jgi:hypothetical protein